MPFEFDERKSEANAAKHGIDFIDAQQRWDDSDWLAIPARTEDEAQLLAIGRIAGKHWSAVVTHRGENVRIIPVRRSRAEEVEWYESK